MARFLIEVPHEGKAKECALAVKVLLSSGSHYLTDIYCLLYVFGVQRWTLKIKKENCCRRFSYVE